ncbi:hypothetical protein Poli38472_002371 [Pythium oligandrum]|uniref:Glutathione S-transferase n=1 Tax=Pythium oligandrum TaxID=41045 RepID=A0A8K1CHQ0_PYTOL|nr:hypothetical protein Poli38472_002371 [Pythium oligandrum]|eukprot:TMW63430.1 hypothetical protein Poli38472_002371 [Pythium oligandrum]
MSPQIKVTYFDGPGRAELTRLALAAGGVAFEDERVTFADFGALKPTLPLGQLPVVTVDGKVYPQSMAMARYAGRLSGLYPTDALEALNVDMIIETVAEVAAALAEIKWRTPEEADKVEKIKALKDEKLPKFFGLVESTIKGKYLLGDKLSLADLYLFDVYTNSLILTAPDYDVAVFPKIAAVIEGVKAEPNVAAYLAKRQ